MKQYGYFALLLEVAEADGPRMSNINVLVLSVRCTSIDRWNFGIGYTNAQCGLRSPVPHGSVLGYIRARILDIVPLRVCRGLQQTRLFSPELAT